MWYLVMSRISGDPQRMYETLNDHLAWMKKMHDAGKILFSGPTPDHSIGIIVVKEDSLDSARHMMDREPWIANGLRDYEIFEWDVHQIMGVGQFHIDSQ